MPELQNLSVDDFDALREIYFRSITVDQLRITFHGIWHTTIFGILTPAHMHDFFEIHYILDGKIHTTVNDVERIYEPGQFYIIPPHSVHSHVVSENPTDACTSFTIRFEMQRVVSTSVNPELDSLKQALDRASSQPMEDFHKSIAMQMDRVIACAKEGTSRTGQLLQLAEVIFSIGRRCGAAKDVRQRLSVMPKAAEAIIRQAIEYIEQRFTEPISPSDVASAIPISYSHLARIFSRYVDSSVSSYIMRVRIDKATHLLMTTDDDVSAIARATGFSSLSYFSYSFKNLLGISPRDFRDYWRRRYFDGRPNIL